MVVAAEPSGAPVAPVGWRTGPCLAIGGGGQVFAATGGDGAAAVLKVAHAADETRRTRYRREAELLRAAGPPWVPALWAAGEDRGRPFLIMERVVGETLAERLARGRPGGASAWRWLAAIADAVAGLHRQGVVHLDLKPENLVLTDDAAGRPLVRLLDLGLAGRVDDDGIVSDDAGAGGGGTIHYAAPEQLAGAAVGVATDVHALGAIGYELLTGRPPFVGDLRAIEWGVRLCRPLPIARLAAVPAAVAALVTRCLAKDPMARPTPIELAAGLRAAIAAAVPSAAPAPVVTLAQGARATSAPRRVRGPVALVWTVAVDRLAAARAASAAGGRVLRDRPDGLLIGFLGRDHARPLDAALAVARPLAALGPTVVHVAELAIGGGARPTVHGDAVDHPERWCPPAPAPGLTLTAAAAVEPGAPRATIPAPAASPAAPAPLPVPAHDAVLADVDRALAGDGPRLITVLGEPGAGASTTCAIVAAALAGRGLVVVEVAGQPVVAGLAAVGAALTARLAAHPGLTWLDRLRAAAERGAVVIVDDGHRVEDEVLDRLEVAAGWAGVTLAIVVAGHDQLGVGRPRWAGPGRWIAAHRLAPLADATARALLRRRLAPARRVADALLARLAAPAGGNPAALVAIADELHRRGAVRRFPGSDEHHVADDTAELALAIDVRWQAARELDRLPAPLARFVELWAVLEPGGGIAELAAVTDAVDGPVATDDEVVDPAAGLAWLIDAGLVRVRDGVLRLGGRASAAAIAEQVDPLRRRAIHRAALAFWRARVDGEAAAERPGPIGGAPRDAVAVDADATDHVDLVDDRGALARVAHHARHADQPAIAAAAYLVLAGRARGRSEPVEAVRLATLAIDASVGRDPRVEAAARIERGLARRPLTHFEDARADFARALALAGDDRALRVRALLGDGEVCDFTDRLAESAAAIEAAAAIAPVELAPAVAARLDNWLGVVRVRQGRLAEADALLGRAVAAAGAIGDHEVAVGATLMLASLRRRAGAPAQAAALLDDVLTRCRAARDVFHLTVALFNRINVDVALGDRAAAERDAAEAIAICERHGYGQMEIAGWNNLRAMRFEVGRLADAHQAAQAAYQTSRRRFARPTLIPTLHLAALEAGLGRGGRATALLAELDAADVDAGVSTRALARATRAAVTGTLGRAAAVALAAAAPDVADVIRWLARRAQRPFHTGRRLPRKAAMPSAASSSASTLASSPSR